MEVVQGLCTAPTEMGFAQALCAIPLQRRFCKGPTDSIERDFEEYLGSPYTDTYTNMDIFCPFY